MKQKPIQIQFMMRELSALIDAVEHFVSHQKQEQLPVTIEVQWAYNRLFEARRNAVEQIKST